MTEQAYQIELLDPVQRPTPASVKLAARLSTMQGSTVVLLDNTKSNSDRLLAYIGEVLTNEYGLRKAVLVRKAHPSFSPSDEVLQDLAARADAIVTGIGD